MDKSEIRPKYFSILELSKYYFELVQFIYNNRLCFINTCINRLLSNSNLRLITYIKYVQYHRQIVVKHFIFNEVG